MKEQREGFPEKKQNPAEKPRNPQHPHSHEKEKKHGGGCSC